MIKFDLERALAGDELVTREGLEVKDFKLRPEQALGIYPYMATLAESGLKFVITEGGKYYATELECKLDLFMKHEKSLRLNIAPFDLKKALAGHALVDSTGCEYDRFGCSPPSDYKDSYPYQAYEKGTDWKFLFTAEGRFIKDSNTAFANKHSLYLKIDKPMINKDFNLELALSGEPVITRSGCRVLHIFTWPKVNEDHQHVLAILESGEALFCEENGYYMPGQVNEYDLFMAPKMVKYYYASWGRGDGSRWTTNMYLNIEELNKIVKGEDFIYHTIEIEE